MGEMTFQVTSLHTLFQQARLNITELNYSYKLVNKWVFIVY